MTPSVYLPGTLCDERVWLPVWRLLPQFPRSYVPLQWANSLSDMLEMTGDRANLNEPVHLAGFSMGAYIAALWALAYPEKVASLTLLGYAPTGLSKEEVQRRNQLIGQLKQPKLKLSAGAYLKSMVLAEHAAELLPYLNSMADDLGSSTLLAHIQSTTPRKDLTGQLSKLTCPVHLIGAEQDAVAPFSQLERAATLIRGATLHQVNQSGHMMMLEQTEQVAELLNAIWQS